MLSVLELSKDGCHEDWEVVWVELDEAARMSTSSIRVVKIICAKRSAIVRSANEELRNHDAMIDVSILYLTLNVTIDNLLNPLFFFQGGGPAFEVRRRSRSREKSAPRRRSASRDRRRRRSREKPDDYDRYERDRRHEKEKKRKRSRSRDRTDRKRDKRDRSRSRERKRDKEKKERKPEFSDIKIKEEPIDGELNETEMLL